MTLDTDGMSGSYGLEISAGGGLAVQAWVNDVPFSIKPAGRIGVQSVPIHGEVQPGQNVVDIRVGTAEIPPDAPSARLVPELPANADLSYKLQLDTVTSSGDGVYQTEVTDLAVRDWEPRREDDGFPFPQMTSIAFEAPADQPVPFWVNADQVEISSIQGGLEAAHARIVGLMQAGDAEAVGRLSRRAYEEAAQAYPLGGTADRRQEQDVADLAEMTREQGFEMAPLETPLICRAYAEGRLFECFTADGKAPVQVLLPDQEPIELTFRFSVMDRKLLIVR